MDAVARGSETMHVHKDGLGLGGNDLFAFALAVCQPDGIGRCGLKAVNGDDVPCVGAVKSAVHIDLVGFLLIVGLLPLQLDGYASSENINNRIIHFYFSAAFLNNSV